MFIIIFIILISLLTHLINYLVKGKESLLFILALPISVITLHLVSKYITEPNDDNDFIQNFRGGNYTSIILILSMIILIYSIIIIV
jgi:hypothetical protein